MKEEKAQVMVFLTANEPFQQHEIVIPQIASHEVLIKIDYTTICTSDLHTFFGRRKSPAPSILGHEIMGTVEALGNEISLDYTGKPIQIGDRITWMVYAYNPCCSMAQKGFPQKSENLYKYGHEEFRGDNKTLNGGFASHCILKKGTKLFVLPKDIPNHIAAPVNCTHATISGALRISTENLINKTCLVVGAGMLGLSACAQLASKGASKIIILDIDQKRLENAKQFGATHVALINPNSNNVIFGAENLQSIDLAIETSGNPKSIELALASLGIGGVLTLVGSIFKQDDFSLNGEHIVRNLLTIQGLHNYIPEDLKNAIEFIQENYAKYPFHELVEAEFPLENLAEAFNFANQSKAFRVGINQAAFKIK